jgi:hypothetical protein
LNKRVAGSLLTGAIALALFAQSDASTDGKTRSFVYTVNHSADYAWITAYGVQQTLGAKIGGIEKSIISGIGTGLEISGPIAQDTIQGAWCVSPGATDHHGLTAAIHTVRIEMKEYKCNYPDVFNKAYSFPGEDPSGQPTSAAKPGVATISGGGTKTIGQVQENLPGGGGEKRNEPGGPASIVVKVPIAVNMSTGASQ